MVRNKTRIRITWAFMCMCCIGMLLGAWLDETSVIITSLAAASPVVMIYVGLKTLDNVKAKQNENKT